MAGSVSNASAAVAPTFKPYETATRDTPMFHMIVDPCCLDLLKPILACIYKLRWMFSYPLRARLLPKWVPPTHLPVIHHIVNFTVGELILCVPLIAFTLQGYSYSFVEINIARSGNMAAYAIFLTYLTANKANSLFSFLMGIPFERMIPLHLYSSLASAVIGVFHTRASFATSANSKYGQLFPETTNLQKYLLDGRINLAGSIALACIFTLVGLSLWPKLRRVFFNLWLFLHVTAAVGVLVALFFHSVSSAVFVTMWWGLDWMVRYVIQAACRYRCPEAKLRRIGTGERGSNEPAIEISFVKPEGFDYNPGQFVQICVPAISIFEFHPISLSSAPHEKMVTLHIRELGDWTRKLVGMVKGENSTATTTILMEGPYGALSVDIDDDKRYKMAICVAGGIGVTPIQSIGKTLLYQHRVLGRKLKNLKFVWAVRDMQMVEDIPPLGGSEDFSRNSILRKRQSEIMERSASLHGSVSGSREVNVSSSIISTASSNRSSSSRRGRLQLPAVVQCDIYCTKVSPRAEADSESQLPYNLTSGRPDVDSIFREMKETALRTGEHNIMVFGCGPKALMRDLEEACRQHSESVVGCGDGVFFDLHTEHFEF